MTPRVRILQIDVPDARLDDTSMFWAEALSAAPRRAPGGFVHLDLATAVPEVHVQPIRDGRARYHLDLEADDLDAEVAFWAAALDAAVEPAELSSDTRLRGVRGPDGAPLGLEIRAVDAPARYRVDLSAQHVRAEAVRLEAAGARVAGIDTGVTLSDPAGNRLCVVPR